MVSRACSLSLRGLCHTSDFGHESPLSLLKPSVSWAESQLGGEGAKARISSKGQEVPWQEAESLRKVPKPVNKRLLLG